MKTRWIPIRTGLEKAYAEAAPTAGPLCDRMLRSALEEQPAEGVARQWLAEMAAELSASWVALFRRTPDWQVICPFGREPSLSPPVALLDEALDREAAAHALLPSGQGTSVELLVVPYLASDRPAETVVFAGTGFSDRSLPTAC
ncbi:MAG TPA: hypothetical protein EYP14_09030, partial [Planctomycetaceae bacterium]|nr:hypothetical protein [Planctomycetaceae bacterium]